MKTQVKMKKYKERCVKTDLYFILIIYTHTGMERVKKEKEKNKLIRTTKHEQEFVRVLVNIKSTCLLGLLELVTVKNKVLS
jgi:thymidylate kinase